MFRLSPLDPLLEVFINIPPPQPKREKGDVERKG